MDQKYTPALIGFVAAGMCGVGIDQAMHAEYSSAAGLIIMAIGLFTAAFFWARLSRDFPSALTESALSVAQDFRWWLGITFLLAGYFVVAPHFRDTKGVTAPEGRSFLTVDANPWDGRPIGVAWSTARLLTSATQNGLRIHGFELQAKNLGPGLPNLKEAYLISGIDGARLELEVGDNSNGMVKPSDTAPVPVGAEFASYGLFDKSDNGVTGGLSEADFNRRWALFRFIIKYDNKTIEHDFNRAWTSAALSAGYPALGPHLSKKVP